MKPINLKRGQVHTFLPDSYLFRKEWLMQAEEIIGMAHTQDLEVEIIIRRRESEDGPTEEKVRADGVQKNMVNRYIDTYGQAHLFCEMHALFRTEYTFDVPGVPYDACEHCGIQNLDPYATKEENGVTPLAITGPGWYRTASDHKARIERPSFVKQNGWYGYVRTTLGDKEAYWHETGHNTEGFEDWMIVARIEQ